MFKPTAGIGVLYLGTTFLFPVYYSLDQYDHEGSLAGHIRASPPARLKGLPDETLTLLMSDRQKIDLQIVDSIGNVRSAGVIY
jgi:hypothetical protein